MNPQTLARFLEQDGYEPSRRYRKLLCGEPFSPFDGEGTSAHRHQVWEWCLWLAQEGYGRLGLPRELGGNPLELYHLAVALGHFDFSLMVKYCVHFGLAMQALGRLGTERHHDLLKRASTLEVAGVFAMTETDHGSNVQALETQAVYEIESQEFVLTTPHPGARKDYIGGAAANGNVAVVFAQLRIGAEEYGVHAFVVPIRDDQGNALPGILLEDCGTKGGLNGVDNGRITFDQVRVPRQNLLDKHGQVHEDGSYECGEMSSARRFFTMIGNLVAGRIMVTASAQAGARTCLTIALRYAGRRKQFGPPEGEEVPILSYQVHQRRLMPPLATLFAIDSALAEAVTRYDQYLKDGVEDRKLETFAGALKAYTSSFAVRLAQECRECCGGAGYLAENRLTEIRNDIDIFTTFEGDNTILYLLVARNLLTDYRRELDGPAVVKALQWATKGFSLAAQANPLKAREMDVTSVDFLSYSFRYRYERLRFTLASRVRGRISSGQDLFEVMNRCQEHCLLLGQAYIENKIYRCMRNRVESCPPGWDEQVLTKLFQLYSLSRLEADRGWFLEQGYFSSKQSTNIRDQVLKLCWELSKEAPALIESFELPDALIRAPIVTQQISQRGVARK